MSQSCLLTTCLHNRANIQQQIPPQGATPVLPHPSYHPAASSGGHQLPNLADLTQGVSSGHHQPSPYNTHPPSNPTHPLSGLGQPLSHQSPQNFINRDRELRELREHEIRERNSIEMHRQHEEAMMREQREHRERQREEMERMHREQQQQHPQHPVQSHTGSIPIHQPVASKVPNTIHGPNGLLSNLGSGQGGSNTSTSNGTSSIFGSHASDVHARPSNFHHQIAGPAPVHLSNERQPMQQQPPFIGPGPSPLPAQTSLPQGQQPILNVSTMIPIHFISTQVCFQPPTKIQCFCGSLSCSEEYPEQNHFSLSSSALQPSSSTYCNFRSSCSPRMQRGVFC